MIARLLERFLRTRYGFVAALGGALLLVGMNEAAYQHSSRRLLGGIALTDARFQAAQTLQWLTDAETAVRGHVLTGDREQLQPYLQALARLPAVRDRAFALVRSVDPEQDFAVDRLQRLLDDPMRYRVESEGGSIRVLSSPGYGTRIEATLPLTAQQGGGERGGAAVHNALRSERMQNHAAVAAH